MKNIIIAILIVVVIFFGTYIINQKKGDSLNPLENITNSTSALNLENKNLTKIPEWVFKETSLTSLNVSNNKLEGSVQGEIRFLTKLKILDLSDNEMTGVPAEIGQLKYLEILDLSNNKLTGLPNELGNL